MSSGAGCGGASRRDRQRLGCRGVGVRLDKGLRRRRLRRVGRRRRRSVTGVACASPPACRCRRSCRASPTSFCSEVMTLLLAKPVAASLTSSKVFLRSAISASRMASWNWPWNSPAILRALPIHCPTMRSTPGSSFGPMAISATTPMTTSSLHPMSNMKNSAHARRFTPMPAQHLAAPRHPQRSCGTPRREVHSVAATGFGCSDSLAADIRSRRRSGAAL